MLIDKLKLEIRKLFFPIAYALQVEKEKEQEQSTEDWAENDIRRAFVAGAKWWEFYSTGGTMWQSDQRLAEEEASRRYIVKTAAVRDAERI